MKKIILNIKILLILPALFFTTNVMTQNITNTLGSGGTFTIKDAATNLFTLSGSTGQVSIPKTLRLETTTSSTTGVFYMNAQNFMHSYGGATNTFIGFSSGNFTHTGWNNTAFGESTLFLLTSGYQNSAFGFSSLARNTSGRDNSGLGQGTLSFNTIGEQNSALGQGSLTFTTSGSYNSAIGCRSLTANTTGSENTAFGYLSLTTNTGGSGNTAFGWSSLVDATGSNNTAIGISSGSIITTGTGNVCLGIGSNPTVGNANNQVTLGNFSVTSLRCNVTAITSLSDARDKKYIKDLDLGADFIMKIKPRLFNWDKREWYEGNISDGTKTEEMPTAGFISQELDEAQTTAEAEWLRLVLKDNPERLEAMAGNLLPVIVKAVQDLKAENDRLKNQNSELKEKNKKYKKLLGDLKQLQDMLALEIEKMSPHNTTTEVNLGENK